MKANLGSIDRVARAGFAVLVAVLYFLGIISGTVALVLGGVGAILLLTSAISFCPIYHVAGLSSKKDVKK